MKTRILVWTVALVATHAAVANAAPFEVGSSFQICGRVNDCEFGSAENVGFLAKSFQYSADGIQSNMSGFAQGFAYYGFLGALASASFDDYRPDSFDLKNGGTLIAVLANAMFKDTLIVRSDVTDFLSGTLAITYGVSGTMRGSGFLPSDATYTWNPGDPVDEGSFASLIINDFAQSVSLSPGLTEHTFLLPFNVNEPFEVKTNLWAGVGFFDSAGSVTDPYDLYARSDFINTVVLKQIVVLDGNGRPVASASIEAASGTTYPMQTQPVPEPAGALLVGAAATAALSRIWRRRSRIENASLARR